MAKNSRKEQLRQMIRKIVREELACSAKGDPSAEATVEAKKGEETNQEPARVQPKPYPEAASLPPRAVFGSPQPAPEKRRRKSLRNPRSNGSYEPEQPLDPPPFISGSERRD